MQLSGFLGRGESEYFLFFSVYYAYIQSAKIQNHVHTRIALLHLLQFLKMCIRNFRISSRLVTSPWHLQSPAYCRQPGYYSYPDNLSDLPAQGDLLQQRDCQGGKGGQKGSSRQ